MVDGLDESNQLTQAARDAVRNYILKLVIPSGVVLSIISALAGFLLKDVIYERAFTDVQAKFVWPAQQEVTKALITFSKDAIKTVNEIENELKTAHNKSLEAQEAAKISAIAAAAIKENFQKAETDTKLAEQAANTALRASNDAQQKAGELDDKLKSVPKVEDLLRNVTEAASSLASSLADNPTFSETIIKRIAPRITTRTFPNETEVYSDKDNNALLGRVSEFDSCTISYYTLSVAGGPAGGQCGALNDGTSWRMRISGPQYCRVICSRLTRGD